MAGQSTAHDLFYLLIDRSIAAFLGASAASPSTQYVSVLTQIGDALAKLDESTLAALAQHCHRVGEGFDRGLQTYRAQVQGIAAANAQLGTTPTAAPQPIAPPAPPAAPAQAPNVSLADWLAYRQGAVAAGLPPPAPPPYIQQQIAALEAQAAAQAPQQPVEQPTVPVAPAPQSSIAPPPPVD